MGGEAYLIRFADDFICCFECESDARRYQSVLPKRLARYSLSVAEEKTKLIRFGRFARRDNQRQGEALQRRSTSSDSPTTAAALERAGSN